MIKSKSDLKEYLKADRIQMGYQKTHPGIRDVVWRYMIHLRKCEYYKNVTKRGLRVLPKYYHLIMWQVLGLLCGFSIGLNCFGKGLSISHIGTIVVNHNARIGENCKLNVCVNIGIGSPVIGNSVYIGPGAKIFGKINIADGIRIGANAVVNKSFGEEGITIVGVPVHKVEKEYNERKQIY